MENSGQLLRVNTELPRDPSIPLPGMYPKEVKTGTQTNTRTHMFTAALFKIDKKAGTAQMSTDGRMGKQIIVYSDDRILFSYEKD